MGNRWNDPIDLYEWMLRCYRQTPKEKLLEFMVGHPDIGSMRELPRDELAKIYCEACTLSVVAEGEEAAKGTGRT